MQGDDLIVDCPRCEDVRVHPGDVSVVLDADARVVYRCPSCRELRATWCHRRDVERLEGGGARIVHRFGSRAVPTPGPTTRLGLP